MGANQWHLGVGFPGYNGPKLPRALRSSRGRRSTNGAKTSNADVFELLAAVAGEMLQDSSAENVGNMQGVKDAVPEAIASPKTLTKDTAPAGSQLLNSESRQCSFVPLNNAVTKPLAARLVQNDALAALLGIHNIMECKEGQGQTQPLNSDDEWLNPKSDNESGTSSVESEAKSDIAYQTERFDSSQQEPCLINQAPHEDSLKEGTENVMAEHQEPCVEMQDAECIYAMGLLTEAAPCLEMEMVATSKDENTLSSQECPVETQDLGDGLSDMKVAKQMAGEMKTSEVTMTNPSSSFMERMKECVKSEDASYYETDEKPRLFHGDYSSDYFLEHMKDPAIRRMKARKVQRGANWLRAFGRQHRRKQADAESIVLQGDAFGKDYYNEPVFGWQKSTKGSKSKRKRGSSEIKDGMISFESIQSEGEPPAAAAKLRRAKAASVPSPTSVHTAPVHGSCSKTNIKKGNEGQVKVRIKSFTVPELYVDIPESATVSTLKRAVMDAAMNLLGGGIRVCVLMQGQKVPDECATLSEIGISSGGESESLGFMLEPCTTVTGVEDPLLVLLNAATQPSRRSTSKTPEVPSRVQASPDGVVDGAMSQAKVEVDTERLSICVASNDVKVLDGKSPQRNYALSPRSTRVAAAGALAAIRAQADSDDQIKNDSDSTSTLSQTTTELPDQDSKAIIVRPGIDEENFALVPMRQKGRQVEVHKRRVRRPFTVLEVEALVLAVEQLGTGRWRDVKLQAFEQAKHRTYVDLKDKWKTLVHTAQIAPHQRRGDPVPEELLERVIKANNYWAAHQAKQQAELDF